MKRVAVVTSSPPFAEGGHLVIARSLVAALRASGAEAELVVTPQNRFGRQAGSYLAAWLTDLGLGEDGRAVDQVVSFRFPSYAVRHPVHVCWLNHRMREYYDLWGRFTATLSPAQRAKERVRRALIHAADRYLLRHNVTRLFAQSKTIQARLVRFGGIPSELLYPPPPQRPYRCDGYGDFLFAVSRLTPLKRMDLLVRALVLPEAGGARCIIAGDGSERPALEELISGLGLGDRVTLVGSVDSAHLVEHLARCRAVFFAPLDEDYGFVTVEAFSSRKAVITSTDSGGPAELVEDGVTGLVAAPTPASLAAAIGRVMTDVDLASCLGEAAARRVAAMTWSDAVARLLV